MRVIPLTSGSQRSAEKTTAPMHMSTSGIGLKNKPPALTVSATVMMLAGAGRPAGPGPGPGRTLGIRTMTQ